MILPFESQSMSNHTKLMENWNKRGAGRVKTNSLENLNVCGLLKLNSTPSHRHKTSCSPQESSTCYTFSMQDTLRNSILGFPLISEWLDVQLTVCLFPFPSTPGYLVLLSSVQTHALFSPFSKQNPLSLSPSPHITLSCLLFLQSGWCLPGIREIQCVYRATWKRGTWDRIACFGPKTWGFQALC